MYVCVCECCSIQMPLCVGCVLLCGFVRVLLLLVFVDVCFVYIGLCLCACVGVVCAVCDVFYDVGLVTLLCLCVV